MNCIIWKNNLFAGSAFESVLFSHFFCLEYNLPFIVARYLNLKKLKQIVQGNVISVKVLTLKNHFQSKQAFTFTLLPVSQTCHFLNCMHLFTSEFSLFDSTN